MNIFKVTLQQFNWDTGSSWAYSTRQSSQVSILGAQYSVTTFVPGEQRTKAPLKTIWLSNIDDTMLELYRKEIGVSAYYVEDSVNSANSKLLTEQEFLALEPDERAMLQA